MTTDLEREPERWPEFLLISEAAAAAEMSVTELTTVMHKGWLPYLPLRPALIERNDLLSWLQRSPERRAAEEEDDRRRQRVKEAQATQEWLRNLRWKRLWRS